MGKADSPPLTEANENVSSNLNTDDDASFGEQNPNRDVVSKKKGDDLPIAEALKIALTGKSSREKMPVSLLYELLSRRGITPQYELLPFEGGAAHARTFRYRVSCQDGDAIGWGQSKKEARHAAARVLMDKLELDESPPNVEKKTPISVLQEVLSRRGICPKYDFIQRDDELTFHYRVAYQDKEAMGTGKSKKEAKQTAAKALIDMLAGVGFWDTHAHELSFKPESTQENAAGSGEESAIFSAVPSRDGDTSPSEGQTTDTINASGGKRNQYTQVNMFEPKRMKRSMGTVFDQGDVSVAKNVTI